METAEFARPKTEWGDGPWQQEPDRVEFEHAGLPCLALRNRYGAWCGYAAVPPDHPLHSRSYKELDFDVHGGFTYSDLCCGEICHIPKPGEPDNVWWFGFDCAHAMDVTPAMDAQLRAVGLDPLRREYDVYRDLSYVQNQIRSLADQLAASR
jgi:hypothetical protein